MRSYSSGFVAESLIRISIIGLFFDFNKIIGTLTDPEDSSIPAFHVVVPSLPGFAWSTLPRKKAFSVEDIARIYNNLMTEVLGYETYMAQGGDWVTLIHLAVI